MGAKQSKRSVDISGKEAEGGGEVAAAGAGGEGRVEPLADVDALKPQLNGDAHIQTEETDKEKDLDSGTPENEKDATTEKEGKEENEKENEAAPVTNGEAEEKLENGESTPAPEDGKKPKKEKVKKKWSLRSISFSRKDKPKQEKKQKDDELKTNGEPEKVPEETAEAAAANEHTAEEVATEATAVEAAPAPAAAAELAEDKDEAAPEPLTNGTADSTPSPVEEAPASIPTPTPTPTSAPAEPEPELAPAPTPAPAPEPEQLPVNGLSLEEPKLEVPEDKVDESKPEPPAAETVEIAPAPEIPTKEVCVQQMPLLESTPPPLPANPPPSSVASFAVTTMAPELADASMPNTVNTAGTAEPLSTLTNTQPPIDEEQSLPPTLVADSTELPSPLKETSEDLPHAADSIEPEVTVELSQAVLPEPEVVVPTAETVALDDVPVIANNQSEPTQEEEIKDQRDKIVDTIEVDSGSIPENSIVNESCPKPKIEQNPEPEIKEILQMKTEQIPEPEVKQISEPEVEKIPEPEVEQIPEPEVEHIPEPEVEQIHEPEVEQIPEPKVEQIPEPEIEHIPVSEIEQIPEPEPEMTTSEIDDAPLPPPPAQDDIEFESNLEQVNQNGEDVRAIPEPKAVAEKNIEVNHILVQELTNGVNDISFDSITAENAKNKAKAVAVTENGVDKIECNGDAGDSEKIVKELTKSDVAAVAAPREPAPAAAHTPQEPVSVSDKLADLIPEVPDVPEINTETLQVSATDVAVAN